MPASATSGSSKRQHMSKNAIKEAADRLKGLITADLQAWFSESSENGANFLQWRHDCSTQDLCEKLRESSFGQSSSIDPGFGVLSAYLLSMQYDTDDLTHSYLDQLHVNPAYSQRFRDAITAPKLDDTLVKDTEVDAELSWEAGQTKTILKLIPSFANLYIVSWPEEKLSAELKEIKIQRKYLLSKFNKGFTWDALATAYSGSPEGAGLSREHYRSALKDAFRSLPMRLQLERVASFYDKRAGGASSERQMAESRGWHERNDKHLQQIIDAPVTEGGRKRKVAAGNGLGSSRETAIELDSDDGGVPPAKKRNPIGISTIANSAITTSHHEPSELGSSEFYDPDDRSSYYKGLHHFTDKSGRPHDTNGLPLY